jgi:hypothetical protein
MSDLYRECPHRSPEPMGTVNCTCQGQPVVFWCSHQDVNTYVMLTKNRLRTEHATLFDGEQVDLKTTVPRDCMTCELRPACQDPLPPIAQQLLSFGSAVFRFVRAGLPKVQRDEYDQRIQACLACPRLSSEGRCAHCGCWVSEKALWQTEECPENRWPKEPEPEPVDEQVDPSPEVPVECGEDESEDLFELSDSEQPLPGY